MTDRSVKELADAIIAGLREKYDLIYVDQRDELTNEQQAAVVAGDSETLWDSLSEWESDARDEGSRYVIEEDGKAIVKEWESEDDTDHELLWDAFMSSGEEYDRVRFEIEERDDGHWLKQLLSQSGDVLLRINVIDEDHGYAFTDVPALQVLHDVGLPASEENWADPQVQENIRTMQDTLAECSPEFSVLLGYWIIGADLEAVYALPSDPDAEVEIVDPYLYLGNPFTGSGWVSEKPLHGVVKVKRSELRTDKAAFGYSIDEIYGGVHPSQFSCEIRAASAPPTTPQRSVA